MRLGCRARMRKGTYVNPSVPCGYRFVNRELMIREDEAEVVRRIFASYLAGKGIDEIAAELTKDKVPKKDGGTKWYYRFHHRHRKHRSKGCKASVKE